MASLPLPRRFAFLLAAALTCFFPGGVARAKEGFGIMTKTTAVLTRSVPPPILITEPEIQVLVASLDPRHYDIAQMFQSQLETLLLKRDSFYRLDSAGAETLILINVLEGQTSEDWENRKEQVPHQAEKEPARSTLPVQTIEVPYKVMTQLLVIDYRIIDSHAKHTLDGDVLRWEFNQSYKEGREAPEPALLRSRAISELANRVASRVTPSEEKLAVLLPKGSLESFSTFAISGQWNRYLEALERRAQNVNPVDESYRQYAKGVAYEALGYTADSVDATISYLKEAAALYNAAISANPSEKYFLTDYPGYPLLNPIGSRGLSGPSPLTRIQSALAAYQNAKIVSSARVVDRANSSGTKLPVPEGEPGETLDNEAVILMVEAGLPDDIILTAIESAPLHSFDISAKGLVQLHKAKVKEKIIARIQKIEIAKKKK